MPSGGPYICSAPRRRTGPLSDVRGQSLSVVITVEAAFPTDLPPVGTGCSKVRIGAYKTPARFRGASPEANESWIDRTTSAPSPTAAATRFVEPLRTSPIA